MIYLAISCAFLSGFLAHMAITEYKKRNPNKRDTFIVPF